MKAAPLISSQFMVALGWASYSRVERLDVWETAYGVACVLSDLPAWPAAQVGVGIPVKLEMENIFLPHFLVA